MNPVLLDDRGVESGVVREATGPSLRESGPEYWY